MNTVKREFISGVYRQSNENYNQDVAIIKEKLHYEDGTIKPNLRIIRNYQRPFWITKKELRVHKDKREYEMTHNLVQYKSTQAELANNIFNVLNGFKPNKQIRLHDVSDSPYVYGASISPITFIHHTYKTKYPNLFTPATLAVMDYEWDVVKGTDAIISGALSHKEHLYLAIVKSHFNNNLNGKEALIQECINKHLTKFTEPRHIIPVITFHDTAGGVVKQLMKRVHELMPDYLGFWNVEGDIDHMLAALKEDNIPPEYIFSDPSVPDEFKFVSWIKDAEYKTTATGKRTPKNMVDRWHKFKTAASYQVICMMATYRTIRASKQLRTSYKLNDVLHDELGLGKTYFEEIPYEDGSIDWHKYMQSTNNMEHRALYIAYMAGDVIPLEIMDEKNNDIAISLRTMLGYSEFDKFKSNPAKLMDDKFFVDLNEGRIGCTVAKTMYSELDDLTYNINGWIKTLSSDLVYNIGCNLINNFPHRETNISVFGFDLDVASAYPNTEIALRISQATCMMEACGFIGLDDYSSRAFGLNLTNVRGNGLQLANVIYGFPEKEDLLKAFLKTI